MRSSPEHRRLRFSFQINNVKDRSHLSGPTRLTPGGRRRRVSSRLDFSCQSPFSGLFSLSAEALKRRQKSHRGCRGCPLSVQCDSIELRNIAARLGKSKRRLRSLLRRPAPVSERGRLLSPRFRGCKRFYRRRGVNLRRSAQSAGSGVMRARRRAASKPAAARGRNAPNSQGAARSAAARSTPWPRPSTSPRALAPAAPTAAPIICTVGMAPAPRPRSSSGRLARMRRPMNDQQRPKPAPSNVAAPAVAKSGVRPIVTARAATPRTMQLAPARMKTACQRG